MDFGVIGFDVGWRYSNTCTGNYNPPDELLPDPNSDSPLVIFTMMTIPLFIGAIFLCEIRTVFNVFKIASPVFWVLWSGLFLFEKRSEFGFPAAHNLGQFELLFIICNGKYNKYFYNTIIYRISFLFGSNQNNSLCCGNESICFFCENNWWNICLISKRLLSLCSQTNELWTQAKNKKSWKRN